MSQVAWLDDTLDFPDTYLALDDPEGLLAIGGDLSLARLRAAYQKGIFPWYSEGQPILWWSPSPRMILRPSELHLGRSNRKLLKSHGFNLTLDQDFKGVLNACARTPRPGQDGTWITQEMQDAYVALHQQGHAHSVETWKEGKLVGGLYGVSIGGVFFGESMFSHESGASKVAFIYLILALQAWGFELIDCQIHTDYLASFGAHLVARNEFESILADGLKKEAPIDWPLAWLDCFKEGRINPISGSIDG